MRSLLSSYCDDYQIKGMTMTDLEEYLNMLKSEDADARFDACDELCVATESSPEIILALEEAAQDEDREVAERARQALGAEVHSQMALIIGRVPPRKNQPVVSGKLSTRSISYMSWTDYLGWLGSTWQFKFYVLVLHD
jgi:hypothetical protein